MPASVQSHPPAGEGDGPLCREHREPMVLRELNGSKVYVCSRWPCNHCSSFCPVEVALVPLRPRGRLAAAAAAPAAAAPQPEPEPASPMAVSPFAADAEWPMEGATPSQDMRTPRLPAAPSKSSSLESRPPGGAPSAAQKSLVPIFASFSPAAIRAAQLGASFVQLKAEARLVATMQQRAAVSPTAAGPGSAQASRRTKRARTGGDERQHAARRASAPPPARHPLQELTLGPEGQPSQQQQQGRQQQAAAAPALQPLSANAGGTWLKSASRKPPRV